MMANKGIVLTIISAIGLTFLIFNSIFETFQVFVDYQIISFVFFIIALILSITYAIIENLDGKGW